MRLKATTDYAIRAVIYLAIKNKQCSSREIAEAMDIPRNLLVQIAVQLKHASILETRSGKYGGYQLAKDCSEISIYDLVCALSDGPSTPKLDAVCEALDKETHDALVKAYQTTNASLVAALSSITIDSIIDERPAS